MAFLYIKFFKGNISNNAFITGYPPYRFQLSGSIVPLTPGSKVNVDGPFFISKTAQTDWFRKESSLIKSSGKLSKFKVKLFKKSQLILEEYSEEILKPKCPDTANCLFFDFVFEINDLKELPDKLQVYNDSEIVYEKTAPNHTSSPIKITHEKRSKGKLSIDWEIDKQVNTSSLKYNATFNYEDPQTRVGYSEFSDKGFRYVEDSSSAKELNLNIIAWDGWNTYYYSRTFEAQEWKNEYTHYIERPMDGGLYSNKNITLGILSDNVFRICNNKCTIDDFKFSWSINNQKSFYDKYYGMCNGFPKGKQTLKLEIEYQGKVFTDSVDIEVEEDPSIPKDKLICAFGREVIENDYK